MLKLSDNHDGLRDKLESIGYTGLRETDESVIQALVAVHLTLQTFDLPKAAQGAVLDLLSGSGRQALADAPAFGEDDWISFDYGNVRIGDFVRIKTDAYDSETGMRHNGLVGVLLEMTRGICTVKYLGLAANNQARHPMEKLDSVKGVYNRRPSQNT